MKAAARPKADADEWCVLSKPLAVNVKGVQAQQFTNVNA